MWMGWYLYYFNCVLLVARCVYRENQGTFLKHFDVLMKKTPLAEVKSRVCCIKTLVRKSSLVCDYYSQIVFVINIAAIHRI